MKYLGEYISHLNTSPVPKEGVKTISLARLHRLMDKKKQKKLEKKYGQKNQKSSQGDGQEVRSPSSSGQAEG